MLRVQGARDMKKLWVLRRGRVFGFGRWCLRAWFRRVGLCVFIRA